MDISIRTMYKNSVFLEIYKVSIILKEILVFKYFFILR